MNADQKKRIAHEISNWKNACNCRAVQLTGDRMAALLQELIDAPDHPERHLGMVNPPEPEPVAWMYEDAFGTHFAEEYSEISNNPGVLSFTALYTIQPALPADVALDAEPVAYVTGVYGGHTTVAPIDAAQVLRVGVALYTAPPAPSVPEVATATNPSQISSFTEPGAWRYVIPGRRRTEKFDSSRVGDYNQGWNDCRGITEKALNDLEKRK